MANVVAPGQKSYLRKPVAVQNWVLVSEIVVINAHVKEHVSFVILLCNESYHNSINRSLDQYWFVFLRSPE